MTNPAVISAAFAEVAMVKSRSVMVLKLEIPLEFADAALAALGGVPQPGSEKWCAIALLNPAIAAAPQQALGAKDEGRSTEGRQRYAEGTRGMQAVTRAALLPKDTRFREWLVESGHILQADKDLAADYIRHWCGVTSRANIADDEGALAKFERLETSFRLWRDGYEDAH